MEIIILVLIIFAISSWVKGIGAQSPNNSNRTTRGNTSQGYTRTGNRADQDTPWQAKGSYDQNTMAKTQEQVDYQKVTNRNDNLRALEERLAKSLRSISAEPAQSRSRNYTNSTTVNRTTPRNMRSGNNAMRKSTYNNHTESSAALRDEIQESMALWHDNLGRMHNINMEFEQHISQQHADQRKWVKDAQSIDR